MSSSAGGASLRSTNFFEEDEEPDEAAGSLLSEGGESPSVFALSPSEVVGVGRATSYRVMNGHRDLLRFVSSSKCAGPSMRGEVLGALQIASLTLNCEL